MTMRPIVLPSFLRLEACRFREFACPMERQRLCHVSRGAGRGPRNAWKVHGIRHCLARTPPTASAVGIERNCFSVGKFNRLELSAMDWESHPRGDAAYDLHHEPLARPSASRIGSSNRKESLE